MTATSNDHSPANSDHEAPTTVATAAVTVEQAAAILGVSVTTVRRRIRAGTLRAEEARRPQGAVWLVYLDAAATSATSEPPPATSSVATAPTTTPQADAMVSLIQTTIATVLAPLVGQIDAHRQTVERQSDQLMSQANRIAEQAEVIGRVTAERDSARAAYASILEAQPAPAPSEPAVPVWRRLWPLALGLAGVLMLVMLLTWPM